MSNPKCLECNDTGVFHFRSGDKPCPRCQVAFETCEQQEFDPEVHCSGIFDRLERFTPYQRAHLFFALECLWCWDCGHDNAEDVHAECGNVLPNEREQK